MSDGTSIVTLITELLWSQIPGLLCVPMTAVFFAERVSKLRLIAWWLVLLARLIIY